MEHNIKLHLAKCVIFAKTIRWCGRLVAKDGVRFDPRRLNELLWMEPPITGANLQQFICALQWVKQGIPQFTDIVSPLHEFMERVYERAGKRSKKSVSIFELSSLGWGDKEDRSFKRFKHLRLNKSISLIETTESVSASTQMRPTQIGLEY